MPAASCGGDERLEEAAQLGHLHVVTADIDGAQECEESRHVELSFPFSGCR